ncbi:Interferon-induced GTP-binding protein Mx [Bienertia sinuspersici]
MKDIQPEIDFWESLVVTYVIGANPPTMLMEGFLHCIWSKYGVDILVFKKDYTWLEKRDKILNMECPFFDSNPMVVKAWKEDLDLTKEVVKTIPIWVKIVKAFKFWGLRALEEIIRPDKPKPVKVWRKKQQDQGIENPNMVQLMTKGMMGLKGKQQRLGSKEAEATRAYQAFIAAQQVVYDNPRDEELAKAEKDANKQYQQKQEIYTQILKQKAKCQWIKDGDSNTKLFHRSIQKRRLQNNVYAIKNTEGEITDTCNCYRGFLAIL